MSKKTIKNKDGSITIVEQTSTDVIVEQAGVQGPKGDTGDFGFSAYEIWLTEGNWGSEADFLNSLIGPSGIDGEDGLSAYEVWLNQGNTGNEQDYLDSLKGEPGATGKSAFQEWLDLGNAGTEADFLNSLIGSPGTDGEDGQGVAAGGTVGQVLYKKSNTDFDTEWKDIVIPKTVDSSKDYLIGTCVAFNNNYEAINQSLNVNIPSVIEQGNVEAPFYSNNNFPGAYNAFPRYLLRKDGETNAATTSYHACMFPVFRGSSNTFDTGGFETEIQFCIENANDPLHKFFVGQIHNNGVIQSMQFGPQYLKNCIGFGYDAADSIFHIYMNNDDSAAIKIPVSDFTGNLLSSDYLARQTQQPLLINIKTTRGSDDIEFTFKNIASERSGKYIAVNPFKKPFYKLSLIPFMALTAGTGGLARTDGFSFFSYYLTRPLR